MTSCSGLSVELTNDLNYIREKCWKDNWDDEHGMAIPAHVVDICQKILEILIMEIEPGVGPANSGVVDIVWAPWNNNALKHIEEGILVVTIDEDEFEVSQGFPKG